MAIKQELSAQQVQRNGKFLDHLMVRFSLKKSADLADALSISPANVCKIRSGMLAIGPTMQIHIHEVLGLSFSEIREYVPPPVSRKPSARRRG
jgi:plasmid maintenance system antidote protein VapI